MNKRSKIDYKIKRSDKQYRWAVEILLSIAHKDKLETVSNAHVEKVNIQIYGQFGAISEK